MFGTIGRCLSRTTSGGRSRSTWRGGLRAPSCPDRRAARPARADCHRQSKQTASGAGYGSRRHTTRPRSRAIRSCSSRSSNCWSEGRPSATRSSASTWRCAATLMRQLGLWPGMDPGAWSTGELLSLTELRHVHRLALITRVGSPPSRRHRLASVPALPRTRHPAFSGRHAATAMARGPGDDHRLALRAQSWAESPGTEPEALANCTPTSSRSTRFSTATAGPGASSSTCCLVRLGYPPAIIYKGDRSRYLAALGRADQDDHGPLAELLARAILDNLHKFVVPAVAGPSRLVPLPALASEQISANALRVAATRGRSAGLQGRGWNLAQHPRLGRGVPGRPLRARASQQRPSRHASSTS